MPLHDHDRQVADDAEFTTDSHDQAELRTLEEMLHQLPPLPEADDSECQRLVRQVQQIGRQPREEDRHPSQTAVSLDLASLGQYKLLAKLGQGGMGTVYKALHTRLNKLVALKLLPAGRMQDAAAVARFEREMRAVGALAHENIVAAHDAGEIDGTHYLVMELVQGVDLSTVLKQQQTLSVADACEIIRQVAMGLQHAYENNLVHRDIKPSNLMLAAGSQGAQVKILDMGLALLDEQHVENPDLTAAGQVMGTLDYMAPEQAGDTHTVDIRADIYSLGATLYKLLTGQVPFQGPQYASTIKKLTALATQDPPRIDSLRADLPAELVEIVQRMLARQPENRFATPRELAEAIAPFAAGANLAALLEAAAADADEDAERTAMLRTSAKGAESVSVRSSVVDTRSQVVPGRRPEPQPASPAVKGQQIPPRRRKNVLLACVAVPVAIVLGVILLSLRMPHGEVVVELADGIPAEMAKNLKIEVSGEGGVKVADEKAGWSIDIAEGKYQTRLSGGSDRFQLDQNQVTVTRGEKTLLKVSLKPAGQTPPAGEQTAKTGPAPVSPPAEPLPPTFTNSIGMEFVLVPRGEFLMGGGGGTPGKEWVSIEHDFYLGKYEVTQEEWEKVTSLRPSTFSRTGGNAEDVKDVLDEDMKRFPVEMVSWDDAQLFLEVLNNREKESGWKYRLPTEAEWEYACRGGPSTNLFDYSWHYYSDEPTNQLLPDQANFDKSELKRPCKVGSYAPNRLGLFDMHGNVREWCEDEREVNMAAQRVSRGGSWHHHSGYCQAASRITHAPSPRYHHLGLRVARVRTGKAAAQPQGGVGSVRPQATQNERTQPRERLSPTFTNSLGMEFVLVPRGEFLMGGGGGTPGKERVTIEHDFYLGKYEVTQEEWEKVTGHNPSLFSRQGRNAEDVKDVLDEDLKRFPVEMVSWTDAQLFVETLNRQLKESGWEYRLPTEAQWEYACRGGPSDNLFDNSWYYYLDKPTNQLLPDQANFDKSELKRPCKVGSYQPNRLGLHDMHGNVREWCEDEREVNMAAQRVHRGGGWINNSGYCQAATQVTFAPSSRNNILGLRVARVPVGQQDP